GIWRSPRPFPGRRASDTLAAGTCVRGGWRPLRSRAYDGEERSRIGGGVHAGRCGTPGEPRSNPSARVRQVPGADRPGGGGTGGRRVLLLPADRVGAGAGSRGGRGGAGLGWV